MPLKQKFRGMVVEDSTYLTINQKVENCQTHERDEVHHHQVEPGNVNANVSWIISYVLRHNLRDVLVVIRIVFGDPGDLKEPRQIVDEGEETYEQDQTPGPAVCAKGAGSQWQTHGDVTFHGHSKCQVSGTRLGNHAHRVDERGDEGKYI